MYCGLIQCQFFEEYTCLKAKHPRVPEEIPLFEKLFGRLEVGFFSERKYLFPFGFDVSKSSFWMSRVKPKRNDESSFCKFNCSSHCAAVFTSISMDEMIRRRHKQDIIRLRCESRKCNGSSGISRGGFDDFGIMGSSGFLKVFSRQEVIVLVAYDKYLVTERRISPDCLFKKCLILEDWEVLLGSLLARKRPKSRTYPTRENDVDDTQIKIKIRRKNNSLSSAIVIHD